jgi:hypothetical protein
MARPVVVRVGGVSAIKPPVTLVQLAKVDDSRADAFEILTEHGGIDWLMRVEQSGEVYRLQQEGLLFHLTHVQQGDGRVADPHVAFEAHAIRFLEEQGWQRNEMRSVLFDSLRCTVWTKGEPRAGGDFYVGTRNALDAEMGWSR